MKLLKELLESLLSRYQTGLKESIKEVILLLIVLICCITNVTCDKAA